MIQIVVSHRFVLCQPVFLATIVCALGLTTEAFAASKTDGGPSIAAIKVGIKGCYKVGCWTPIRIETAGGGGLKNPRVEIVVPDSDSVPTTVAASLTPAGSDKGSGAAVIYTKVGRLSSSIQISLVDGKERLEERTIHARVAPNSSAGVVALSPTDELIVSFGSANFGIAEALHNREAEGGQRNRQIVEVNQVADLPAEWFGYEAVDVFVLSAGDGKLCQSLAKDRARHAALARWVELGGRLVIFCGGQSAQQLFDEGAPLAKFAPGKFSQVVPLRETSSIEHFANSAPRIPLMPGAALRLPKFIDVQGNIDAYEGKRASDLPIVVRSPHGLGEVAFAGLDFSQPPLADWSGRGAFLQALVHPYFASSRAADSTQQLVTHGYNDLAGALRQRLGHSFVSVAPIGFAVVAGLAIAYMVFLGPLDYLLVNRWVRRPWVAWISFPLIVLAFSAGAMSLSDWRTGSPGLKANNMEVVDVDTLTHSARGTFWTALFSPAASQVDLSVRVPARLGIATNADEVMFSWWGLAGTGIGGMQSSGAELGIVRTGYTYGADRRSLSGVPLLASATKSLMARWAAPAASTVEADLTDQDGLAVGSITNRSGPPLRNVRLLYGTWAYKLGGLNVGQRIEVGEQLSPRKIKTIVTHEALGETGTPSGSGEARVFDAEHATPKEILSLMMFYDAAGGFAFAHLPDRYQSYCDLSRLLDLGRAILVADTDDPGTQIIDRTTEKAIGDARDESTVIYRFVLPVKRGAAP